MKGNEKKQKDPRKARQDTSWNQVSITVYHWSAKLQKEEHTTWASLEKQAWHLKWHSVPCLLKEWKTIALLLIGFRLLLLISFEDQSKENHEISVSGLSNRNNTYDLFWSEFTKIFLDNHRSILEQSKYMHGIHVCMVTLGSKGVAFLLFFSEGSSSRSGSKV